MNPKFYLVAFILFPAIVYAQTPTMEKNNAVLFEIGKIGLVFNLSYDHRVENRNFGYRVSAGSSIPSSYIALTCGGGFYYLKGKSNRFFEIGGDLNYLIVKDHSDDDITGPSFNPGYQTKTPHAVFNAGYRAYGKRTLFKVGAAPGFTKDDFIPGGYLSFGITF